MGRFAIHLLPKVQLIRERARFNPQTAVPKKFVASGGDASGIQLARMLRNSRYLRVYSVYYFHAPLILILLKL